MLGRPRRRACRTAKDILANGLRLSRWDGLSLYAAIGLRSCTRKPRRAELLLRPVGMPRAEVRLAERHHRSCEEQIVGALASVRRDLSGPSRAPKLDRRAGEIQKARIAHRFNEGMPLAMRSTPKIRNNTIITASLCMASQPFAESSCVFA
jgi:hypothetical protein